MRRRRRRIRGRRRGFDSITWGSNMVTFSSAGVGAGPRARRQLFDGDAAKLTPQSGSATVARR